MLICSSSQEGDMPLHVLLETWRLATLHRLGEVQHDPVDVWFGAIGDKRLIRSVLAEDPTPFTDGDPFPWFAPLFVSISFLLDVDPTVARCRNRVRFMASQFLIAFCFDLSGSLR